MKKSYFEVTDWDETADINLFLAGTVSSNTYNGFSALFGNLYITFADLTSHWNDV
ncbi:MAG: hypothetical protein IPH74_03535, partial [Bacteroidetes bacterium]|nr:hypothetical protein [Bacteroidota bacterium]